MQKPDMTVFDDYELESRVEQLLEILDEKLKEAGPILEKIGRLREEIAVINDELVSRANDGRFERDG